MKSAYILAGMLLTNGIAYGNPTRISNELATVKACDEIMHWKYIKNFDLKNVSNATASDTGKAVTVSLRFTADVGNDIDSDVVPVICTSAHWYKYDGTPTDCESCQNKQPGQSTCTCSVLNCETADHRFFTR